MGKEFEIRREFEADATPEQVWDAVATADGQASWLFPMGGDVEPRVGGAAPGGHTVTAWDPPHHFAVRAEGEGGWYNALEHIIEARDGGTTWIRYCHSGVFADDWDNQYDGADKHTDFYLHTLGEYLRHFSGRKAAYVGAQGPDSSNRPGAFAELRRALGLADDVAVDDAVRIELPGIDVLDGTVDYLTPDFLGIRTADGLYRFFVRQAFGAPVSAGHHLFAGGVDEEKTTEAWSAWLKGVYEGT
jgi:uncharacterized protein YndB with AHSA1/START domain